MMTSSSNTEVCMQTKSRLWVLLICQANSTIELLFRDYRSPWTCFGGPSTLVPLRHILTHIYELCKTTQNLIKVHHFGTFGATFVTSAVVISFSAMYTIYIVLHSHKIANTFGRNRHGQSLIQLRGLGMRWEFSLVCASLPSLAARLSGIICLMKIPKSSSESEVMFLPPTTRIPSPFWQPLMIICWACFFLAAVGDSEVLWSAN